MTLITFQSRIHFASHVLEEALRAEIEENGPGPVLVLFDAAEADSEFAARVFAGFPDGSDLTCLAIRSGRSMERIAEDALLAIDPEDCRAVVAFGSARAIAHARQCRHSIAFARYGARRARARQRLRERDFLPEFYAIPGVDGLPDSHAATGLAGVRAAPPSVIICDPSLTLFPDEIEAARAFATALGRCLSALGCDRFNPLADGLAVEGLRLLVTARATNDDGADGLRRSRDFMAAALNGAIAQQKGVGVVQAYAQALADTTGREVDGGALQRILLPRVLDAPDHMPSKHDGVIRNVLNVPDSDPLGSGIEALLAPLPLADALHKLGLSWDEVCDAADSVAASGTVPLRSVRRLEHVLEDIY